MEVKEKRNVSEFYDELGGCLYDKRYKSEQKAKYDEILRHCVISENSVVLDDGCGTGLFLKKLKSFSVGIDLSPSLLSVARQRKPSRMQNHLILGDADELPFKDCVFHKILAVTLIQNMPEPLQTLKEIRFYVEGTSGTIGFCNITISKELLLGELSVYKDDTLLIKGTDYFKTQNASHWSFYITFEHSAHSFKIMASNIIPEFPSWTPLLMIILLSVTFVSVIYKRKL